MSRVAYVNGRYVAYRDARVHIDDRGYQFADGVYEVIALTGGRLIDEVEHLDRLDRSLRELRIPAPMARHPLQLVLREVVRRNGTTDGVVYIQVTRGVAPREHVVAAALRPQLVITSRRTKPLARALIEDGARVRSIPEMRWARCDIKSTALLPNILAKQQAREAGAFEAWFVDDDGCVTEGGSTNAWIVTRDGELVTRPLGPAILGGITRMRVIALARAAGLRVSERAFTLAEAKDAREAFVTSASAYVLPVVQIDDRPIGNGHPGSFAQRLRELYVEHAERGEKVTGTAGNA